MEMAKTRFLKTNNRDNSELQTLQEWRLLSRTPSLLSWWTQWCRFQGLTKFSAVSLSLSGHSLYNSDRLWHNSNKFWICRSQILQRTSTILSQSHNLQPSPKMPSFNSCSLRCLTSKRLNLPPTNVLKAGSQSRLSKTLIKDNWPKPNYLNWASSWSRSPRSKATWAWARRKFPTAPSSRLSKP